MEMTVEMIQRAKEIAEELHYDYAKVGIRVQEVPFELGEMSHRSHVCVDGEETEEELDGVCAQDVETLGRYQNQYYGNHIAIVAGNEYSYGEDPGELIIRDPVVVEILA